MDRRQFLRIAAYAAPLTVAGAGLLVPERKIWAAWPGSHPTDVVHRVQSLWQQSGKSYGLGYVLTIEDIVAQDAKERIARKHGQLQASVNTTRRYLDGLSHDIGLPPELTELQQLLR